MKCFHHNDMDGYCSAAIVSAETNNKNKEDYIEIDYIAPIPTDIVENGETVYFVDYSFSGKNLEALDELINRNCNIIWIDHHRTSTMLLEENPKYGKLEGIIKEGESGALLTYKFFHKDGNDIPKAIRLVSDYDCWQFKYGDETTYFKLFIDTVDNKPLSKIWHDIIYDRAESEILMKHAINSGKMLKTMVDQNNTWYRNHYGYESELNGIKCFVINQKTNSWVFGEKYYEYPLCVAFAFNGEKYVYTLYSSDPNIDCEKIAKQYGGGGHSGAAGLSSVELLVKKKKVS